MWRTRMSKIWILSVAASLALGCAPTAMPREFAQTTKDIALSMLDQTVWDDLVGSIQGQVIAPGVRVAAGVLYIAEAKITGASGHVNLSGEGHGTQDPTSPEVRAALIAVLGDNPELIDQILADIAASARASKE